MVKHINPPKTESSRRREREKGGMDVCLVGQQPPPPTGDRTDPRTDSFITFLLSSQLLLDRAGTERKGGCSYGLWQCVVVPECKWGVENKKCDDALLLLLFSSHYFCFPLLPLLLLFAVGWMRFPAGKRSCNVQRGRRERGRENGGKLWGPRGRRSFFLSGAHKYRCVFKKKNPKDSASHVGGRGSNWCLQFHALPTSDVMMLRGRQQKRPPPG